MKTAKFIALAVLLFPAAALCSDDPDNLVTTEWVVMSTANNAPGGDWTEGTDFDQDRSGYEISDGIDSVDVGYWEANTNQDHYIIFDFGSSKTVGSFRTYSTRTARGPIEVNIYIAANNEGNTGLTSGSVPVGWGSSVYSSPKNMNSGTAASYPANAVAYNFDTVATGRYALVHIIKTAYTTDYNQLRWGDSGNIGGGAGIAAFQFVTYPSKAFSTIYNPTGNTDCEWAESSAVDCDTLLHYQSGTSGYNYYQYDVANQKITLDFNLPAEPWPSTILGVRVWWRGKEYTNGNRKYWPRYLEGGNYYGQYADYTMLFTDTDTYYYIDYPYDPYDGAAWTLTDMDTFKPVLQTIGPLPGGIVYEYYIEVLWQGDTTAGAYLTHRPWAGGETDTEMIVKARASAASEVRIGYATNVGDLLNCLDPDSDCSGVTVESDPASDNAIADNDFVHTNWFTGLTANTVYYWTAFVDNQPAHLMDGANVERLATERVLTNEPDGSGYTISSSSPGWTVNAWTEYQVVMTSGSGNGNVYTVASNTADTLTCNELIAAGVAAGDKFILCRPHCKWTSPPAFKTAPTAQTDVDHTEILIGDMHSYARDEELFVSAGAEGANRAIFLGDNHAENSQAMERTTAPIRDYGSASYTFLSAGVMEGYRRLVIGNDSVNQHLRDNILNDHTIAAATISDHDYGGNNPSKTGDLPVNCYSGLGLNDTDHIASVVTFSNTNSTITIDPDLGLEEIKVYENDIILEVTGNATYNGYYQADISSVSGDAYTFSVTPAPASDASDVSCVICFHKRKMFNCVDAFKTYMPTRIDPDGDGLGDVITAGGTIEWPIPAVDLEGTSTGGDTDTIIDTTLKEWQFEYDNLSGGTPEPGDDIDINGDDAILLYYDPTDSTTGTMFVRMDTEAAIADGETVQVEGGGDWSCTIDADGGEHLGWIKEGPFGLYPGMVVHYEPDDADDYSLSFVKSISGTTLELSEALWAGETFAANSGVNAYRFQRATLNARGYHARDQYITLDVRGKRDHSIGTYGNPGGDWIDGTNDHINPKIDGKTVTGVSGATIDCSSCGFTGADTDPFGRPVRVGDLVECDFDGDGTYDDDSNYYALVESITDSDTIVLSQAITGCAVDDKIRVSESGGSEHGSRKANINAGALAGEEWIDTTDLTIKVGV